MSEEYLDMEVEFIDGIMNLLSNKLKNASVLPGYNYETCNIKSNDDYFNFSVIYPSDDFSHITVTWKDGKPMDISLSDRDFENKLLTRLADCGLY